MEHKPWCSFHVDVDEYSTRVVDPCTCERRSGEERRKGERRVYNRYTYPHRAVVVVGEPTSVYGSHASRERRRGERRQDDR